MEQSITIQTGYARLKKNRALFIGGLLAALVILIGVAVTLGSADFTVAESYLAILAGLFPPGTFTAPPDMAGIIIWDYRLHRVLFAVCAGFGLAVAGSVMQGDPPKPAREPPLHPRDRLGGHHRRSIAIVLGAGVVGGGLPRHRQRLSLRPACGARHLRDGPLPGGSVPRRWSLPVSPSCTSSPR